MPKVPVVLTVAVVLAAVVAVPPVRDAVTLGPTAEAHLHRSLGYALIAPISAILDTLTLLSIPQHISLGVWAIALFILFRIRARRQGGIARIMLVELGAAVAFVGALFVLYASVAFLPRPMASIVVASDDVLSVDFHLHTRHSHDGRDSWTAEHARAWARGAGYDAAYITDHRTYQGAEEGRAANPPRAGDGTVLLAGIEVVMEGEHVNILSAGTVYRNLTTPDMRDMDLTALAIVSSLRGFEPVVIETVPGNLSNIIFATGPGTAGVRAIELIDGAPRGLTQTRRERGRIIELASDYNLALVVGSDNHGYGRTAAGWTLMRIPGWQESTPDSLASLIEETIRDEGFEATHVVERRIAGAENPVAVALMPLTVGWRMLTTLSMLERVMWLVWVWGIALGYRRLRPARTSRRA